MEHHHEPDFFVDAQPKPGTVVVIACIVVDGLGHCGWVREDNQREIVAELVAVRIFVLLRQHLIFVAGLGLNPIILLLLAVRFIELLH